MAQRTDVNSIASILRQVNRMVAFIELEGNEKAESILNKTEEEYNLLVGNMVQNGRRQLVDSYDKKLKYMSKERYMREQILTNESKMNIYSLRQDMVNNIINEIEDKLHKDSKDEDFTRKILYKCILQSLIILLEKDVIIQVLERDAEAVDNIISDVSEEFEKITGTKCRMKVAKKYLPPKCIGGCVIFNKRCTLKVTNTVSERFKIILDEVAVTTLRTMLFGGNPDRKFFT